MRRTRAALAVIACGVLLGGAVPAVAGTGTAVPREYKQRLRQTLGEVAKVRAAMASGRILDAVRATTELRGPAREVPPTEPAEPPAGVPAELAAPVARLLGAIDFAGGMAAKAVGAGTAASGAAGGGAAGGEAADDAAVPGLDAAALQSADYAVAAAIDAALPEITRYAAGLRPARRAVAGCDVVDALPRLCVGGAAANHYGRDGALVIDLGGDDRHTHSAGGADPGVPFPPPGGNGIPVAVTIDVGGDDVYDAELPTASGARVAQGGGYGGIGFLVDRAGDDRYRTATFKPFPEVIGALGQGVSILGTGVLADLSGDDRYLVESHPRGTQMMGPEGTAGLGVGGPGVALLYDRRGDDVYRATSRSVPVEADGTLHLGEPNVIAFGAGFDTPGVFFDGGGDDRMTALAETPEIPATETRPLAQGDSLVYAFGYGSARPGAGGYGMSLSGPGRTVRRAIATTSAPRVGFTGSYAFGHGSAGGIGVQSDAGGDDRYEVRARADARARTRGAAGGPTAAAGPVIAGGFGHGGKVGLSPNEGPNNTQQTGGFALMQDLAGDDRYLLAAVSAARAESSRGTGAAAASTAGAGTEGQGYGTRALEQAGSTPGAGVMHDYGGSDAYQASVTSSAQVRAPRAAGRTATAGAATSHVQAVGIGGGYGELLDRGGEDRYRSLARAWTGGAGPSTATVMSSAQGSVEQDGFALFRDIGGRRDEFRLVPADEPCAGSRGGFAWRDCGTVLGAGFNFSQ